MNNSEIDVQESLAAQGEHPFLDQPEEAMELDENAEMSEEDDYIEEEIEQESDSDDFIEDTVADEPVNDLNPRAKCSHGYKNQTCRECFSHLYCEHNRLEKTCKDCGGADVCPHDVLKAYCRRCSPNRFCKHDKHKSACVECNPKIACEHGKKKSYCKICGPLYCEHGKQRKFCLPCGGKSLCIHGRQRSYCRPCGGTAFCHHGVFRRGCKECGKPYDCPHGKKKNLCKDCGGVSICPHGKTKWNCIPCKGSGVCEHEKLRKLCLKCGGANVCAHEKEKKCCKVCSPANCPKCDKVFATKYIKRHLRNCKAVAVPEAALDEAAAVGEEVPLTTNVKGPSASEMCVHDRRRRHCSECFPVVCKFCGKITSQSNHAKHLRSHGPNGEKPVKRGNPKPRRAARPSTRPKIPRRAKENAHYGEDDVKEEVQSTEITLQPEIVEGGQAGTEQVEVAKIVEPIQPADE